MPNLITSRDLQQKMKIKLQEQGWEWDFDAEEVMHFFREHKGKPQIAKVFPDGTKSIRTLKHFSRSK